MAESKTMIFLLAKANYPTLKVQCCMMLVRDGLWGIVSGTETAPEGVLASGEPFVTLLVRGTRRSCRGLAEATESVPEENVGK